MENTKQTYIMSYTKARFESFKKRFAINMMSNGLDNDSIASNGQHKTFIAHYVQTEVIDKKDELAKDPKRISRKLSHMTIETPLGGRRQFPVILEYNSHELVRGYSFGLNKVGSIEVRVIEMLETPIIL